MSLTQAQIDEEKKNERAYNQLSEKVIGYTGWGRFYPLMRSAAALGEGNIPHKVCVDKEGREITVYNTDTGKVIGTFLKPAHEQAAKDLAQGHYGWATADLLGFGWINQLQQQKDAQCVIVKPNDVLQRHANSSTTLDQACGKSPNWQTWPSELKAYNQCAREYIASKPPVEDKPVPKAEPEPTPTVTHTTKMTWSPAKKVTTTVVTALTLVSVIFLIRKLT